MSKRSKLLFLVSLINFLAVFICIFFMPKNVVFKFNAEFQVETIVNRWLNIIIPALQLISAVVMIVIDIKTADTPHFYRYIVMYIAISIAMFYTWIMIVIQFGNYSVGDKVVFPVASAIIIPIAMFIQSYSYYQSTKTYRAFSIFGYSWVRNSPIVWQKTHMIASVNGAICSILMIACAVINDIVFKSNWVYVIAFLIWAIVYYLLTFLATIRYKNYV